MNSVFDSYHPTRGVSPNHVGIIPDGSRRWAKIHGVSYYESYDYALEKLSQIIDCFFESGTNIISTYFSSSQNFDRPESEVEAFCKAEANFCDIFILPVIQKYNVRVDFCGNEQIIPQYMLDSLQRIKSQTKGNSGKQLNLCVAYNPFDELWHSIKYADSPAEFLNKLWVSVPLDLIVRTGKANLISNFLPLQSGFARLYFPDKLFNDLNQYDVKTILEDFRGIERRYGE